MRKRGEKMEKQINREDDIERYFIFSEQREKYGYTEAISRLANREKIDERSVQRALARGLEYIYDEIEKGEVKYFRSRLDQARHERLEKIRRKLYSMLAFQNVDEVSDV